MTAPYDPTSSWAKRHRLNRHCACGTLIYDKSKSGQCKSCFASARNATVEHRAKVSEAMRRKYRQDPNYAAMIRTNLAEGKRASLKDPVKLAKQIRQARINIERTKTPEAVQRREEGKRRALLPWCPRERIEDYRALMRKGLRAAEAKAMILEEIRLERTRLSPFERQMASLEAKMKRGETALIASNDMFRRRAA
jgi:hypothetical protein